jgi:hypothetical protein
MLWVLTRPGIKGWQRGKIRCRRPHPLERGDDLLIVANAQQAGVVQFVINRDGRPRNLDVIAVDAYIEKYADEAMPSPYGLVYAPADAFPKDSLRLEALQRRAPEVRYLPAYDKHAILERYGVDKWTSLWSHDPFDQAEPEAPEATSHGVTPGIRRMKASDLLNKHLPPLQCAVEPILPSGTTLLTGRSKDGKSLMAYNLAVAVASGGKALGQFDVQQGSVWYLALEDGERRAQARLRHQMDQYGIQAEALEHLEFATWDAPRLGEGLEEELKQWITTTPDARLIIIDILNRATRHEHSEALRGYVGCAPIRIKLSGPFHK